MKFLDIEINEMIYKRLILAIIILIIVYMAFTMSTLLVFKTYTLGPSTSENDETIRTHIDSLIVDNKKIEITGWAYKEGQTVEMVNSNFILKNQDTGKMYLMKTVMEKNASLAEIGCGNAGLHAQCLRLGLPKGKYQIFVLYRNDGEDILADTLIPFEI